MSTQARDLIYEALKQQCEMLEQELADARRPSVLEAVNTESACFGRLLEIVNVEIIAHFSVTGEPTSKARARFTAYGSRVRSYTPEKTKTAEREVALRFRQAAPQHRPDDTHQYGLACVFFAGTRQRRDVDNMLKLISDGLNGVAWADDSQVAEVTGRRGSDLPENARTEVLVYRLGPYPVPTRTCEHCGHEFKTYKSWSKKKYCDRKCGDAARRTARQRTCIACGANFLVHSPSHIVETCSTECRRSVDRPTETCVECGARFSRPKSWAGDRPSTCSHDCQVAYWSARRTSNKKGSCDDCGGPVSRKEYRRCRACAIRARKPTTDRKIRTDGEGH